MLFEGHEVYDTWWDVFRRPAPAPDYVPYFDQVILDIREVEDARVWASIEHMLKAIVEPQNRFERILVKILDELP